MCGIFGVINSPNALGLAACAKTLHHRGPDAFGEHYEPSNGAYLAHCRLSIIDTSDAGRQPMSNESGTLWLTFNGEVYNFKALRQELVQLGHQFRSQTDSEVVLHAYEEWGADFVNRLDGMFAFGLWDNERRVLTLVRDRVGIKPLYFVFLGAMLAFASEPKALLGLPGFRKVINPAAIQSLLTYGYIAGEDSIWGSVRRLEAGSVLTYNAEKGSAQSRRFWQLRAGARPIASSEAAGQFNHLLSEAVKSHLVADVPVGVFLSGGLDSSAIANMAATHRPGVDTFSIGFEHLANDELPAARQSARLMGSNHREATVGLNNVGQLMEVFRYLDEPLGDSAIFPTYLVSREARKQVKVALSGDGGDELLGGYRWYHQVENTRRLKKLMFLVGSLLGPKVTVSTPLLKRLDKQQHYLMLNSPGYTSTELSALFPDITDGFQRDEAYLYRNIDKRGAQRYKAWQLTDFKTFLVDNNLVRVDRLSMACSLEVRVPFLDHRLVEFAFSLPDAICLNSSEGKLLLRRYLDAQGMGHLLRLPKRGFSASLEHIWPVSEMVSFLRRSGMKRDGLLSANRLESLLKATGSYNFAYRIWLLATLEVWYQVWYLGSQYSPELIDGDMLATG